VGQLGSVFRVVGLIVSELQQQQQQQQQQQ